MAAIAQFFTSEQKERIAAAIEQAELNTSGEIRVHLENKCKEDVLDRAAHVFSKLKMHQTERRNGVLIYLAVSDHKLAIIGDAGIHAKVPTDFWDEIKEKMRKDFKERQFERGICDAIKRAGEQLKSHFPYQKDDINELPNEISLGS